MNNLILDDDDKKMLGALIYKESGDDSFFLPICNYLEFLTKKNNELNLISRKLDNKTIIVDHIYDSLVGMKYFKKYPSITDIGSGGGLPALILAILFPFKRFNLVEKSHKKSVFLKEAVDFLKLKNVWVFNRMVDQHKIETDVVTCRAFKDISTILRMTKDFFEKGGIYILYKARLETIENELRDAMKVFDISCTINKVEEIEEKERHIVMVTKKP